MCDKGIQCNMHTVFTEPTPSFDIYNDSLTHLFMNRTIGPVMLNDIYRQYIPGLNCGKLCGEIYFDTYMAKRCKKKRVKAVVLVYKCFSCGNDYSSSSKFLRHYSACHEQLLKPYE